MNNGRSDASTSTDDVKERPLCLFYFSHPFGVVSEEPPTVTAAPPELARVFLDMEPVPPFFWPSSSAGAAPSTTVEEPRPPPAQSSDGTRSGVRFELGVATGPVPVSMSVARARRRSLDPRRDSYVSALSSSPFSSEAWFPRRASYARILPPLRLPSPRDLTDRSSDDVWPRRCLNRFSLPPIELPMATATRAGAPTPTFARGGRREEPSGVEKETECARGLRVKKLRCRGRGWRRGRRRGADVRRMVACLMRRAVNESGRVHRCGGGGGGGGLGAGGASPAPALRRALATIREAWREPAPASLLRRTRCRVSNRMYPRSRPSQRESTERDSERESEASAMPRPARTRPAAEPQRRPDASPGLIRRRYSVPETIMRKYRLAQQNSDSEESVVRQGASSACLSPRSGGESPSPRHLRHDRELMRKSALLRRMWARPSACSCERETRSLEGSHDELREAGSRARWAEPKRQRLADRAPPSTAELSDSTTFRSRDPGPSHLETDAPSLASASPPADRSSSPPRASFEESDAFSASASISTAKETPCSRERLRFDFVTSNGHREGPGGARACPAENDDCNAPSSSARTLPNDAAYEMLEICVSESTTTSPPEGTRTGVSAGGVAPRDVRTRDMNIDEYVSHVLVESLASLSDRLEGMSASVPGDRKLSVVEKEIKVRLQNAGVNTIVHLSPTSNNQIIFGNEELCNDEYVRDERFHGRETCDVTHDECNNPLALVFCDVRERENNNASPLSRSEAFDAVLQHDKVNRAVLHQIQKLFRDEMHQSDSESGLRDSVSHVEISNVDVFLDGAGADTVELRTRIGAVGAGNYYRDDIGAALVPRLSAYPHSASMEVNTSSSSDAEADGLGSDCASLVDSLDDPNSPRGAVLRLRRRPELARSAVDVLELLPEDARGREESMSHEQAEAFFVGIRDDATPAPEAERVRVAEYMPERIRQKLHRRHRKRELRMECARRGKVRQLREELERRRRDEQERVRRDAERHAVAVVEALLDDVIAKIAREEYRDELRNRRNPRSKFTKSEENLDRRNGRTDSEKKGDLHSNGRHDGVRRSSDDGGRPARRSERHHVHGKLLARPSILNADGGPRRIYQKSEIREGDKCIEILEILEYAQGRSSPDTTPSDEGERGSRARRSRIPVPTRHDHMRLTGGATMRAVNDVASGSPAPPEPRGRSNSLRFKRVFDMIPEERSSISLDSSVEAEDAESARRASASDLAKSPRPAPPLPGESPRRTATRSAGTSPQIEARCVRTQTTMTSPHAKSAATSPLRSQRPRPPTLSREGSGERREPVRPERRTTTTRHDRERRAVRSRGGYGEPTEGRGRGEGEDGGSSSSGSSGSLLCSLAPRWLSAHARQRRRAARHSDAELLAEPPPPPPPLPTDPNVTGGWSVTVAGSCRAALPADVEMRLRFPHERRRAAAAAAAAAWSPSPPAPRRVASYHHHQECACAACGPPALPPPPARPPARPASRHDRLTLTMNKEAQDSSLVATKSVDKCTEPLPELETYRTSRTKLKSSVKTRRGYSLHCWLPDDETATLRANNGLSVLGCAIIPELKPRVPTMSERDLTRVYTPRHYLRS